MLVATGDPTHQLSSRRKPGPSELSSRAGGASWIPASAGMTSREMDHSRHRGVSRAYPAVARSTNRVGISTGGVPGTKRSGSASIRTISLT